MAVVVIVVVVVVAAAVVAVSLILSVQIIDDYSLHDVYILMKSYPVKFTLYLNAILAGDNTTGSSVEMGRKEMFYLTTHSTHFICGYMASFIW